MTNYFLESYKKVLYSSLGQSSSPVHWFQTALRSPTWVVQHLQLFTVQKSLTSACVSTVQCSTWQFSLRYRHSYASLVSPPPPNLRESARCSPLLWRTNSLVRVGSLVSTSLAWSDRTLPWLRALQLLLPDCICFSCCSPIASVSACYLIHTVQSTVSTKVAHHYHSPAPWISTSVTHRQTDI